jgi:hyaluronan synthase
VAVIADWPHSRSFAVTALVVSIGWNWITAMRMFTLRRSDQGWLQQAEAFMVVPIAIAWMTLVLRPIRLYGQLTMRRQGWVTRGGGAETRTAMEEAGNMKGLT